MKYFLFSEFFVSLIFAVVFGVGYGCVYKGAHVIFSFLRSLCFLIPKVIIGLPKFSLKRADNKSLVFSPKNAGPIFSNVLDFFVILLFGLCTILLYYSLLDGVFRFYFLIVLIISFKISEDIFGKHFAALLDLIYKRIYRILYNIISFFLLPISFLLKPVLLLILKIEAPIKMKIKKHKTKRILKRKISEIDAIMENHEAFSFLS